MRFLRFVSVIPFLCFWACSTPYKELIWIEHRQPEVGVEHYYRYRPDFSRELYRAQVNGGFLFKKYHLSGLLLFKKTDTSKRVIFTNELGYVFFDFGWDTSDHFTLHHIIPQMQKDAVIRTLRKDLELLLGLGFEKNKLETLHNEMAMFYKYPLGKGSAYYIEDTVANAQLTRIEHGVKRPVVTIYPFWNDNPESMLPDSFSVIHHKAHFTITAKRIESKHNE
jgi:hypothetical protein